MILKDLIFSHCTLVPGRNEAAYYASKFLFNWKSILGSPTDTVRLKDFLFKGFENLKWINDPEVKFEFITEKILKISLSSVSDYFLTISIDGTQARLEINYSEGAGGEPSPPASPKHSPETLYDFIVTETDDGEIGIYNPKFS